MFILYSFLDQQSSRTLRDYFRDLGIRHFRFFCAPSDFQIFAIRIALERSEFGDA